MVTTTLEPIVVLILDHVWSGPLQIDSGQVYFCRLSLVQQYLYWWHISFDVGPSLGPFHGAIAVPSRVVVVVVDIDAQAARDSTASDICWMGVRQLIVANGPNIFQMLLVIKNDDCSTCQIWSVSRCSGASVISHTTGRLDCQLITTNCCSKHAHFITIYHYWTRYWLGRSIPGDIILLK